MPHPNVTWTIIAFGLVLTLALEIGEWIAK